MTFLTTLEMTQYKDDWVFFYFFINCPFLSNQALILKLYIDSILE